MSKRMIGPFELGDKLGVGGMGVVYRAVYPKTGRICAVKVLSPDVNETPQLQKRFEREMEILKKLQHPNIVRYLGGGKVQSQRFYAMELVQGGSLESYLKEKGKLPWDETVEYARQIAIALEHAHAAGVIHRDLKPANLLMTTDRQIKLTDFGIARDTTATALTAAGKTVGTYAYMAPEQIRGKPPVDRRTDLYALGCVMFEMLTGETPFHSDNPGEILVKHLQDEPPRVTSLNPKIPIWLEELVFRLLEKDPDERYFDALALQVALDEVKEKVSRQASLVATGLAEASTKTAGVGSTDEKPKKKKKKVKKVPFWEQLWFLATCLALVLGLAGWQVSRIMYPSEDALMARIDAMMVDPDSTGWIDAKDKYLPQLLQRFPQGKHAARAQEMLDSVEMRSAEDQARNRGPRPPKSEGERLFLEADKFEKGVGDRVTALEIYQSMIELLAERPEERVYVLLAKRQAAKLIAEGADKLDRATLIEETLQRAEDLYNENKVLAARNIWNSIVTLYRDNQELDPLVEQARMRLEESRPGRRKAEKTDE